jgi:hypothetical protein
VASPTRAPAANQTVSARLTGLTTGTLYYVSVTAVDASGNESHCLTPAHASVPRAGFSASPTGTVNFGTVKVGSLVDQKFTVQNTGGGTISGTAFTSSGPFTVVSGSSFTLTGVGATQTVTVRFKPTVVATATANVNFKSTSGDSITRIVTGTGSGSVVTDTTRPSISIKSPLTWAGTYYTKGTSVSLAGTASDGVGVTKVTWVNSRGGSGTATGTTSWTASGIPLQLGTNVITVTARDAAGNTATATLTVSRS